LIERESGDYTRFHRTPGGATRAVEERLGAEQAAEVEQEAWTQAQEELELVAGIGADYERESFLAGESSPVLFGAALPNFGISQLLQALVELAPAPQARSDAAGEERPVAAPFSGQVFKM